MLIRKTQQPSNYPANSIHDAYSDSQTDTYSCNYINQNNSAITLNRKTHLSVTAVSWTNFKITFDNQVKISDKLSVVDNSIKIGANVNHVRISAKISYDASIPANSFMGLRLNLNNEQIMDDYEIHSNTNVATSVHLPSFIIPVNENDVLTLYGVCSSAITNKNVRAMSTYFTVEVVD